MQPTTPKTTPTTRRPRLSRRGLNHLLAVLRRQQLNALAAARKAADDGHWAAYDHYIDLADDKAAAIAFAKPAC